MTIATSNADLNVAQIASPFLTVPPTAYGGTEQVVHELCISLQELGHNVVLYCAGDSTCAVPKHCRFPRAFGTRIGDPRIELEHLRWSYAQIAARGNIDIVHDHTPLGPRIAAAQYPDLRVVATAHLPLNGELRAVYRSAAKNCWLVAISRSQANAAPEIRVAEVIPHGTIRPERYPFGTGNSGYVGFLGRMSPDKGVHRAITAASAAEWPLIIAAKKRTQAEEAYFETHVKPRLGGSIYYIGEPDRPRSLQMLAGARCLLFPIRWDEPFGLVLIEALACGTPVLTFREGAAPEIIDHGTTGFICDDEKAMAAAIWKCAELDRSVCRSVAETRFGSRRMAEDYVRLFRRALGEAY